LCWAEFSSLSSTVLSQSNIKAYSIHAATFRVKSDPLAEVCSWWNRGMILLGKFRSGQVRSGQVRSGQVRSGQVRSGQVRSGQVRFIQRHISMLFMHMDLVFCLFLTHFVPCFLSQGQGQDSNHKSYDN
jgi:hypothetical protein